LDINDHVNLKEKIRNSTAKRNALADDKGINAASQGYLLDKALIIMTAYAEVDQELRMLADGTLYSPDAIQAQRQENMKRRNANRGTTNDNLFRDAISQLVGNQRGIQRSQANRPLPGMESKFFDLPMIPNTDQDDWTDVSHETLANLIRYIKAGQGKEKPGSFP